MDEATKGDTNWSELESDEKTQTRLNKQFKHRASQPGLGAINKADITNVQICYILTPVLEITIECFFFQNFILQCRGNSRLQRFAQTK